jgi:hypothetical protein
MVGSRQELTPLGRGLAAITGRNQTTLMLSKYLPILIGYINRDVVFLAFIIYGAEFLGCLFQDF